MTDELDTYFARLRRGPFGASDPNAVPQEGSAIAPASWYAGHAYSLWAGQANMLQDPALESLDTTMVTLGTTQTSISPFWAGHYVLSSGGAPTVGVARDYDRGVISDNPFNSAICSISDQWSGATDHTVYVYQKNVANPSAGSKWYPYLIAACRMKSNGPYSGIQALARVEACDWYGAIVAASAEVDLATGLDWGEAVLLWGSGAYNGVIVRWRLRLRIVSAASGSFYTYFGEPQLHMAYTPDLAPFQPQIAGWVPSRVESYAGYGKALLVRQPLEANGRFWIWGTDGQMNWGDGTQINGDVRMRRSAPSTVAIEDASGGKAILSVPGGPSIATKAGIPVDSDWPVTPPDGTVCLDTTDRRLYVRCGGVWRYVALT